MTSKLLSHVLGAACAFAVLAGPALAQAPYPSRPIKLIVPFTAGGGVDTIARILADAMKTGLGGQVIVENVPGASEMRGTETTVRSEPDGYTILMTSAGAVAVNPHLFKSIKYDVERDLAPISLVVRVPNVFVVKASSPLTSVADLVAAAKKGGKLSYSSSGIGNPQHLAGELFNKMSGAGILHIPYRGAAQQVTDVLGDNVTGTFASYLAVSSFVEGKQVRALAVTSKDRMPNLPDVPAMAETPGLEGYDVTNWFGLFAPAKTPPAIVEKLNKAVVQALADPAIAKKLEALGTYPAPTSPADFKSFVAAESTKFRDIIAAADIKAP